MKLKLFYSTGIAGGFVLLKRTTKMPADLKDQLAFLFAHKENALLRFYKYNKYTKHNSIPTKHLKIMFFDKVH